MDGEFEDLLAAFSAARMEPYLKHCNGDVAKAFRLYAWNLEVSAALSGPLGCLEVALRNALHEQLVTLVGRSDWWRDRRVDLHDVAKGLLAEAAANLAKRGKPAVPDAMVAELHFGFWVALLGKGRNYETTLWRPALRHAFPNYSGGRLPLHKQLDSMRYLRNRIAHAEPIHRRHLKADHGTILDLIGRISPPAVEFVRRHDRVEQVLRRRRAVCDGDADPQF
ncbi:hypothetical protein [Kutzneria sp. 744]|uniref:hypothetical protein n=1 Tax=Kutzneria sp. (strain 744) TaxID=345341 RepID=UPI0005BB4B01|nr:hypothetical protein [Kutzneria sp. 744]